MADEKNPFGGTSLPLDGNAGGRVMRVDGDVLFQGNVEIRAGRFIAATEASMTLEPTDIDFSGCFMSAEGEAFGDDLYNIGGVNAGVLQFGLSSTTGKAYIGGGAIVMDISGITATGLRTGLTQLATAGGETRYGVLEMFVPQGGTTPAFGMSLSDNDESAPSVITNSDFATGDLTGWTQTGTSFSAGDDGAGGYCLACAEITGADEEIVSDRFAVTDASKLAISVRTKDVAYDSELEFPCTGDMYTHYSNKTTNYGSDTDLLSTSGLGLKIYSKYDFTSAPSTVYSKHNFTAKLKLYFTESLASSGWFKFLNEDWVEAEATYNEKSTGVSWTSPGNPGNFGTPLGIPNIMRSVGYNYLLESGATSSLGYAVYQWISGAEVNAGLMFYVAGLSTTSHICSKEGEYPSSIILNWTEQPDYEVVVRWYDDATAGSLLRTDVIAAEDNITNWNTHTANLSAPAGALSAEVVVIGHAGQPFYIDDVSVVATTVLERIFLKDDGAYYQGSVSSGVASRLALASEIPTTVYPDYFIGNGALLQMYDSSNNRKALTVTVINANTHGGMAGYSAAAVAANGDYYLLTIPLRAGTYSFKANYTKNTDYGKFDLYVGATKVSGATPLDCYASSVSNNNEWAITGITIAADGWQVFKVLNVGKNTSSSDYRLWMGAIAIYRTA